MYMVPSRGQSHRELSTSGDANLVVLAWAMDLGRRPDDNS